MKKSLLLAACLMMAAGCAAIDRDYWGPNCGGYSMFQAHTMIRNGYPSRIAVTPTDDPNIFHAQAQAMINGKWEWLKSDPALVWIGEKESEYPVIQFMTVKESISYARYDEKTKW